MRMQDIKVGGVYAGEKGGHRVVDEVFKWYGEMRVRWHREKSNSPEKSECCLETFARWAKARMS
jgi:hypothetical protein